MGKNPEEKIKSVKTIENTMDVLDMLRKSTEPMGVNEIARKCELSPATTYRILKSLAGKGWVYQLSDDGYVAGKKLGFVTSSNNFYVALVDAAKMIMDSYTDRYGMTMNLFVRDGANCELIAQSATKNIINPSIPLHTMIPCNSCASGKVLLSELPEEKLKSIINRSKFEAITSYTITNPAEFRRTLTETRERGYATEFQELSLGGSCVAVPVRSDTGEIIAGLSFSVLLIGSFEKPLDSYVPVLQEASREITNELYR